MIIACPACATRYVVPDSSIGIEGRTVRCAKCKHSWFQDGPDAERMAAMAKVPTPAPAQASAAPQKPVQPAPRPAQQPRAAAPVQAPGQAPRERPAAPPPPPPSPVVAEPEAANAAPPREAPDFGYGGAIPAHEGIPPREAPDFDESDPPYGEVQDDLPPPPLPEEDDAPSRFEHAPPFRPRRNMARLWTIAAAIFALLAVATIGAVSYVGLPDWVPVAKPLFGVGQPDLELKFPVNQQDRRTLANGTEFFGARIVVKNTARESRAIPPILIVLRDQRERQVYSWVVNPPQATLAPGEELTINEAVTDVPKSAVFADIGWAPR